jgi:acyl carrier protein
VEWRLMLDERLKKVFVEVMGISAEQYHPTLTPAEVPSWDSLGHVQLVTGLQKEFGIELDVSEIMEMEDAVKIKEVLQRRGIES